MSYSISQERAAQDKLAQIWKASSRRERLSLATRFGYGGSDASKLRSMRRLLTSSISKGQYAVVTDYFRPYVTVDSPDAWKGRLPSFAIKGNAQIMSQIMYVREYDDGDETRDNTLQAFEVHLNADGKSNDMRTLFESYNKKVKEVLGRYSKIDPNSDYSSSTLAIAFSQKGVEDLIKMYDYRIKDPRPDTPYGIAIVSTTSKYGGVKGDKKRLAPEGKTYQRSFPKSKRDDMIEFANRSYSQMKRKGGRLA